VLTGLIISGLSESLHRSRRRSAAGERRHAVTLASIGDAVLAADARARVTYLNPAAEALTGWPLADAVGRPLAEVFRVVNEQTRQPASGGRRDEGRGMGEETEALLPYFSSLIPHPSSFLVARDGRATPIDDCGAPILDDRGRTAGVVLVFRDVTQRRRAEEAEVFRASEQRWRSLTEALPQLVWSATPDGACDYFSTQWTEHTGVAEAELLGWRWLETLHPEDRAPTRQFWLESVAGRHPYDVEYRVRRRDGEYRWFKTRGVPIRDGGGTIVKWFGTCTDITDLRQSEAALRRAMVAAEAANRAKDEFLANVSHEIRTPMNAILGMTELALASELTEDQRQSLRTVKSAADNLLGIINDLLDFAKIEAGKVELDSADFGLRAAVGDTLRALAVRAHAKGLKLTSRVGPDVPDALVGDAGRLRQVLLNLVGNAVKFTEHGEVIVSVEVTSDQSSVISDQSVVLSLITDHWSLMTDHWSLITLHFSVSDTGIGIPLDKQEKIFQAFEQEDASTTRRFGGTGLGLTIASQLVALMGGRITVDSEPGRGSTFAFTARFGCRPHQAEPAAAQSPAPAPRPLHGLVAEDNEFNAQLLEQLLGRRGHRVRLAGDGRAALALAEAGGFDLLLLDVHMPELDGFQVARGIRERERTAGGHLPIIALTARARREDRERCLAAGMDDFLAKPIQAPDLWAAIDRGVAAGPPAGRETPGLLDAQVLLSACGGDAAILEKLCQAFRARLPDHMQAVQDALSDRDAPRLREAAHKLCGMVAAFSTAAGGVASELEDQAALGRLDEARPLVGRLGTMAEELMRLVGGLSFDALRSQAAVVGGSE
jgi:PAS domain S-box-containing protein